MFNCKWSHDGCCSKSFYIDSDRLPPVFLWMYSIRECIETCHDFVHHTFVQFDLLFYSHKSPVRRSEEPLSEHESSPPASNLLPSQIQQQQSQHHQQQHQSSRQHDGQQQQQRSGTTLQQQMNPLIAGPNISSQQSRQVKQANIRYAANIPHAVKVMPSPYYKWNVGNSTEWFVFLCYIWGLHIWLSSVVEILPHKIEIQSFVGYLKLLASRRGLVDGLCWYKSFAVIFSLYYF